MAAKEAALRVVVFLGSVRENNMGSRAAKFMVNTIKKRGHHVDLLGKFASRSLPPHVRLSTVFPVLSSRPLIGRVEMAPESRWLRLQTFFSCPPPSVKMMFCKKLASSASLCK